MGERPCQGIGAGMAGVAVPVPMTLGEFRLALVEELESRGYAETWAADRAKARVLQGYSFSETPYLHWIAFTRRRKAGTSVGVIADPNGIGEEAVFPATPEGVKSAADHILVRARANLAAQGDAL